MNISFNISPTPLQQPNGVQDPQQVQQTQGSDRTLTVSITTGAEGSSGVLPTAITLTYPMIGPEDIALNEVMQQLKNLDLKTLQGMQLSAAVLVLNQHVGEIAGAMVRGGPDYIKDNAESLNKFFTDVEAKAKQAETQLFDLINNSTYPEFNDFLSKMLVAAQDLRELASKAKHSLLMADYNNVLDQAKQMEITAQKNYESTMKEIAAAQKEAIGKIVSGVLSIASTFTGMGLAGKGHGMAGGNLGAGIGSSLGGIMEGAMGIAAGGDRAEGAALKKEADLADAIRKKMEATEKLISEAIQVSDELRDIGKTLADMVLKLYQDFISSQNQIVQRANV